MSANNSRDFSKYDSMTNEELEEILRLDINASAEQEMDADAMLYILEVLSERNRAQETTGKTAKEAWESFQKNYMPEDQESTEESVDFAKPSKPHRSWISRLVAAAAAIALIITIPLTAKAFGWSEIWDAIAKWANETFSFVSSENVQVGQPDETDAEKYTSLQDVLINNGREPEIIPSWIPARFILQDVEMDINPVQEIYRATYVDGSNELRIHICNYLSTDLQNIEVNEDIIEIYKVENTEFYIFNNVDELRAIWLKDSFECYISGDVSMEEIKKMINSIEKG